LDDLLRQMQGGWYSQDDPNSQITVLGAERVDTYDVQEMGSAYLRVQDRCNDYQNAGPYLIAREPETGTTDCYVIDYIDTREMTLMYLPRGNFLTYRRLD